MRQVSRSSRTVVESDGRSKRHNADETTQRISTASAATRDSQSTCTSYSSDESTSTQGALIDLAMPELGPKHDLLPGEA